MGIRTLVLYRTLILLVHLISQRACARVRTSLEFLTSLRRKPGEIPTESNYGGVRLIQFEQAFNPTRAFGVSHVRGDRAY